MNTVLNLLFVCLYMRVLQFLSVDHFWIGLREKNGIEGHWEWLSGKSLGYTNWNAVRSLDVDFATSSLQKVV